MNNLHIYLSFFLVIFLMSCAAQEKQKSAAKTTATEELPFTLDSEGLERDAAVQIAEYVVEIMEDSKGNLWFGTMGYGAARYDGETLTYFSITDGLPGNTVASIAEDKAGNMWFGTHTGASKYDGKSFTNFGTKEGLSGPGCNILVDSNGNIWAGTNHGAFRYDGTKFSKFEIPKPIIEKPSYKWEAGKIWSLIEDSKGNIWFGRDGYGACKFDGTSFTHFTQKDGLCSNNVSSIVEDSQGNMWFGSLTSDFPESIKVGGLSHYDGENFTQFPAIEGLSENDIYTIYKDKSGKVWIGAIGVGAYRYDGEQFELFKEREREDLTYSFGLQSILEDKKGRLWFGFSGGLFHFNGTYFINVTKAGPWE